MIDMSSSRRALCATFILILVGLSLPLPGVADPPHQELMPELLWPPENPAIADPVPMFVREDRVLRPDGTLDTELFTESAELAIRRDYLSRAPGDPCLPGIFLSGDVRQEELLWQDFRSVVEDSDIIVVTRVTGVAAGFMNQIPGTLVRLTPMQWLKGEGSWQTKYRFIPAGNLTLGEITLCIVSDQQPEPPEVNDRVLVAYRDTPVSRLRPLLVGPAARFLVLSPQRGPKLPRWVREKHPEWTGKPPAAIIGDIKRFIRLEEDTGS